MMISEGKGFSCSPRYPAHLMEVILLAGWSPASLVSYDFLPLDWCSCHTIVHTLVVYRE
jgi:hypothetical protein